MKKELPLISEAILQEERNSKPHVKEKTSTEPLESCELLFPSSGVEMKRQRSLPKGRRGESSLALLGIGAVANWTWDELMDGFAMSSFQVKNICTYV